MHIDEAVYGLWEDDTTPTDLLTCILSQAKGTSVGEFTYDWDRSFGLERAERLCDYLGLPYVGVLKIDVERAYIGQPPLYFMDHLMWVELYRLRHSIDYVPPVSKGLRQIGSDDMVENLMARIESGFIEAPRDLGWACPREQSYFYQTDEWKNCAKAYRYIDGYHCWRCSRRNVQLHVHHRNPIISAFHHNFTLNFAWWKLETTCHLCHTEIHSRTVRGIHHYGYEFVEPSEVLKEKAWLRRAWAKHHADGVCGWCNQNAPHDDGDVNFYEPVMHLND